MASNGNIFRTAIAGLFKAVRSALVRQGVNVGGTAAYPRVELHSFVENSPADKEGRLRSIDLVVECISDKAVGETVDMLEQNIVALLSENGIGVQGFELVGIVPGQSRLLDEQEVNDQNRVIYRIIQNLTVWLQPAAQEPEEE